ncbi:MAG: ABC transporter ATP-binding protein [Confluentimicrobium sp.]|uniref:ABC transporter ATP-binding protein n=1 Tax=Actibacterium sp. TaxID=1872125 RepID=UPI000C5FB033|nr:ABC transporter ATP-binding protein [Actibacterium sp.]MBC57550.1 ABC transporter ATP-binding protein [Actibacterium sp.]|tara:strand:+ start:534 stop:1319 length:786 start_codon:yes stop_codon:yes gene_type:complete
MTLGLSIKTVSKMWNPDGPEPVSALSNLSLDVAIGEFVVLLGPSGCGKSTLLYIVAGLEAATQGSVTFDGLEVTAPSPERSLIFQEASLYPWLTVKDNITFGLKIAGHSLEKREKAADRLLRIVGLAGAGDRRPHELSGGMRQRAALARALSMEPKVLLMDEPFAALDIQTRARMQKHLLDIWETSGASVLLVTHSIEEALALADRVVVFTARPGQIKAQLSIDAPRPRDLRSPEMIELARQCEALLAEEVEKSFQEQELA